MDNPSDLKPEHLGFKPTIIKFLTPVNRSILGDQMHLMMGWKSQDLQCTHHI
jgi:hypothetical protein